MNRYISKESCLHLLDFLPRSGLSYEYDYEKHRIVVKDEFNSERFYIRLPLAISPINQLTHDDNSISYIILLIQSGSAAIGFFDNGVNTDHKVFKSYMVRMKQGKSQIKYLKTRGKSKAGSRVRLGETVEFFENINERLQSYFKEHKIDRIAISCSKILIPYLYNSKVETPFDKNDARTFKIPKHINLPNFEVMTDINKFLLRGEIVYEESEALFIEQFLKNIS